MLLVPVVGRARLCWDFAATVYILHLFVCTFYTRFPYGQGGWEWWSRQVRCQEPWAHLILIPQLAPIHVRTPKHRRQARNGTHRPA